MNTSYRIPTLPLLLCISLLSLCPLTAQSQDESRYDFIRYDANVLHYDSASPTMASLFQRWQRLAATGSGNLNIVHIGGSHVQAGVLSNTMRCNILPPSPTSWPRAACSSPTLLPPAATTRPTTASTAARR